MKVILTENIKGAGKKGDVVDVKEGYGRNFLLPRGLALLATAGNLRRFENVVKELSKKKGRDTKHAEEIKEALEGTTLTIKAKTGLDGKLFGSITSKDVASAVKDSLDVELDKRDIRIDEPIRMTGSYTVEVHLEQGINANLKVEVEQEE